MTVPMWLLVSRGRPLTSMQAKKKERKKKKLFHLSRFISRLFLIPFKLKHSCMLGWGWDDMLWWLKYRHCFDAVVSYYNLKWDIMLKSVRVLLLQWKGTTATTACFSGCLKINQRLADTWFHLKHRFSSTASLFILNIDVICRNWNSFRFVAFSPVGNYQ